jgi:hypothetical protein
VQISLCVGNYRKLGRPLGTTFSACASVLAISCRQQAGHYDLTSGTRHIACESSSIGISVGVNSTWHSQQAKLKNPPKSHSTSMPAICDSPGGLVALRTPSKGSCNAQVVSEVYYFLFNIHNASLAIKRTVSLYGSPGHEIEIHFKIAQIQSSTINKLSISCEQSSILYWALFFKSFLQTLTCKICPLSIMTHFAFKWL